LDPDNAAGYFLRGSIFWTKGNAQAAVRDLKRALAIDPNNADTLLELSRIYAACGKRSSGEPLVRRLLAIDPLTPINHCMPGYFDALDGKFESAVGLYHRMYEQDPENPSIQSLYVWPLLLNQQFDEALSMIELIGQNAPGTVLTSILLMIKDALQNKKSEALQFVTEEIRIMAKRTEWLSREVAHGFALLGEKEEALNWLENAINQGFINYPFLSKHDPFLANLRGEERFKKLMERVKYEWEHFEV
jgi:tetratricopeptide (TPR) repeat protein